MDLFRRFTLLVCFMLAMNNASAQDAADITGYVVDAASGEALSFCHVVFSSSGTGTITNEEGFFLLKDAAMGDTLVFSFIGYARERLPVAQLSAPVRVALQPITIDVGELTVFAEDDFLYSVVYDCQRVMNDQPFDTARTYFNLETTFDNQPLEMIECYYNAEVRGAKVHNLELKNGRVGWPLVTDGRYFVNLETTKAIAMLDITAPSGRFPFNPLQFRPSKMKKRYDLTLLPTFSDTGMYHIAFEPLERTGEYFSGELWIDKKSNQLLKIHLDVDNATQHPFDPIGGRSRIDDLDLRISYAFGQKDGEVFLENINFNYSLVLRQDLPQRIYLQPLKVETSGVLFFYDYREEFILPFFDYDPGHNDYRKISFLPYDSLFWENDLGFSLSAEQRERRRFLEEEGVLLNFSDDLMIDARDSLRGFFEMNNAVWSAEKRIHLKRTDPRDSLKYALFQTADEQRVFQSEQIELTAQLFLDVNDYGDRREYKSAAVFDVFRSYNTLEESSLIDCIANIHFDLAEMERRQMIAKLASLDKPDPRRIASVYMTSKNRLERDQALFMFEIALGADRKALAKWNAFVVEALGVDNMALFNISGG